MATIDQRPARLDLYCAKGDDMTVTFVVTENGSAWVSTGATITSAILDRAGTVQATNFTTAASTGSLTFSLTDTQTTTLGAGQYRYWVAVTKSGDTRTWVAGSFTIAAASGTGTSSTSASLSLTTGSVTLSLTSLVAPTAANISFTPTGTVAATDVQTAIAEVASEAAVAANVAVTDSADYYAATNVETVLAEIPSAWKHKSSRAFMRGLANAARPTTVVVMGDSTANGTDEWAYLTATWLGTKFPAFTVHHRLWNDTAQGWDPETVIQTGTAGEAYFTMGSTDSRAFTAPDSAAVSITGDMSVRVKLRKANWTSSAADCEIFNKFGAGGNRSWRFIVATNGNLIFEHSNDGTTLKSQTSSAAVGFANNAAGWVRADLDVDNGASGYSVTFYTSPDNVTWTQLGTTKTAAGVSSVFDSTQTLSICNRGGTNVAGDIYAADLYSGITATNTLVAAWRSGEMYRTITSGGTLTGYDVCGNLWTANSSALTQGVTGAPVITWRNASTSGQVLSYFTDTTRFAKINTGRVRMTFTNLGHNETTTGGDAYFTSYSSFLSQITTANPATAIVIVGQNPKASPEPVDTIEIHRDRIRALAELAGAADHGFVDAYVALNANTAAYVGADGIHPTTAGSALWALTTERFLLNA